MKRFIAILLLTILSLSFIACDGFNIPTQGENTTKEEVNITDNGTTVTTDSSENTTTSTDTTTTDQSSEDRYQVIDLYSINDFHGGAYNTVESLEMIGGFLLEKQAESENTIILSNGDIFQGAALSNYYHGRPIVEIFNTIGFDGFVIGNHEFDWGIDEILQYRDSDLTNGEMDYPILAANIVYEDTQFPLVNTVPYIIKEVNGVRVGIIGLIDRLEGSISASKLENIEFKDPEDTTYHYARELREDENCDIVVAYIHGASYYYNNEVAAFTGSHRIDAVFNGHSHSYEEEEIRRSEGAPLFYAQVNNRDGSSDGYIAHIALEYDTVNNEVVYEGYDPYGTNPNNSKAENYKYSDVYQYTNTEINAIINDYSTRTEYVNLVYEVLATTNQYLSTYDLAPWGANVIRDYTGVDFGAINAGGFRVPIESGDITMEKLMEVYPFDNYIKTCEMTGSEFKDLYFYTSNSGAGIYWDDSISESGYNLYIDGVLISDTQVYTIGAVDYIFDYEDNGFLDGANIQNTGFLMRDLLVEDLRNVPDGTYFDPDNGTNYIEISTTYDPKQYWDLIINL